MRNIEKKMIQYIDDKIALNGAAQYAIANKDARGVFAYAMEACVGIRETGGNNSGPMVELIQETVGGHSKEAWCMAFVQTCIAFAEVKTGIVSRLPATEHCLTCWRSSPQGSKVLYFPLKGAVIIWKHGSTDNGHTGMFIEGNHNIFSAVEGNTESGIVGGVVERDGGGVYMTNRSMKGNGDMKIMGFLKPF